MSKHLVFHDNTFKMLEHFISMVSMTIRSHSACKETEGFHKNPYINNKFLCNSHVTSELFS